MTGRLPESYIAPEHVLDLRARFRLRHAPVDQRGKWQQRIHAVLYHHGHPPAQVFRAVAPPTDVHARDPADRQDGALDAAEHQALLAGKSLRRVGGPGEVLARFEDHDDGQNGVSAAGAVLTTPAMDRPGARSTVAMPKQPGVYTFTIA